MDAPAFASSLLTLSLSLSLFLEGNRDLEGAEGIALRLAARAHDECFGANRGICEAHGRNSVDGLDNWFKPAT